MKRRMGRSEMVEGWTGGKIRTVRILDGRNQSVNEPSHGLDIVMSNLHCMQPSAARLG